MTGPEREDERGGGQDNLTRRLLTLGLGAYFMTEDTVRRYVKDAKIPRDLARGVIQNATKGKEELYGFVARELSGFLRQMDIQQELDRFVRSHKIRVSAEIEFLPKPLPAPAAEAEEPEDPPGARTAATKDAPRPAAGAGPAAKEPGAKEPGSREGPALPDVDWAVSFRRGQATSPEEPPA